MRHLVSIVLLLILIISESVAQRGLTDSGISEEELYASTKQINQFFRRFNGEEDEKGNRYYPKDDKYRDATLRKKYLPILFDNETGYVQADLAKSFVKDLINKKDPAFIDFHSGDWLAEVNATFSFKGKESSVLLYMKLQKQGQGYEWIIDDVSFDPFKDMFDKDTSEQKAFIHPMSHELSFMTLRKAFANTDNPEQFTSRKFEPDQLTLFIYEMKKGNLKFTTVKNVKFHFFEIDNWYFEVSNFNRPGYNTGWLISNLVQANADQKKQLLDYIYDKN